MSPLPSPRSPRARAGRPRTRRRAQRSTGSGCRRGWRNRWRPPRRARHRWWFRRRRRSPRGRRPGRHPALIEGGHQGVGQAPGDALQLDGPGKLTPNSVSLARCHRPPANVAPRTDALPNSSCRTRTRRDVAPALPDRGARGHLVSPECVSFGDLAGEVVQALHDEFEVAVHPSHRTGAHLALGHSPSEADTGLPCADPAARRVAHVSVVVHQRLPHRALPITAGHLACQVPSRRPGPQAVVADGAGRGQAKGPRCRAASRAALRWIFAHRAQSQRREVSDRLSRRGSPRWRFRTQARFRRSCRGARHRPR